MNLINLTGRVIRVMGANGEEKLLVQPSNLIANASIIPDVVMNVSGVDVVMYQYKDAGGLPPPKENTIYIISYAVLQALKGSRKDVIAPDTSRASIIRKNGKIIGVQRFVQIEVNDE